MSSKLPIFTTYQPQHFTDHSFDPQLDYFRVLGEARKIERRTSRLKDLVHFKLPMPFSRHDSSTKIKKNKKLWWRNALHFIKRKCKPLLDDKNCKNTQSSLALVPGSIFRPVYITESRVWASTTFYRTTSRPRVAPLAGTIMTSRRGDVEVPYISLEEINKNQHCNYQRMSNSIVPIYLVT